MWGDLGFTLICMAYFFGGITIGYYIPKWRKSRKPKGDGRWDQVGHSFQMLGENPNGHYQQKKR